MVSVSIVLATEMLSVSELVINRGANPGEVGLMIVYLLPDILLFTLPAATLMAVVVAFLRLSADNEVIAMQSSGISLYQMLPPVALLSFLAFLASLLLGLFAAPWGARSFKDVVFRIAQSQADLAIEERVFSEPFPGVVFYVNEFSRAEDIMKDVFVVDRRDDKANTTIVADKGKMFLYPEERTITIQFRNGFIFVVEKDRTSANTIRFKSYTLNIGLKDIMSKVSSRGKEPEEMYVGELVQQLEKLSPGEKLNEAWIELSEKITVPLSIFLMGIIGVPLGAGLRARARSLGIGISLLVFFIYYTFLGGIRNVAEAGVIHPALAAWMPDMFLLASCALLLKTVSHNRSFRLLRRFFPW